MAITDRQRAFMNDFQKAVDGLGDILSVLETQRRIYVKSGYSSILDADLVEFEATQALLTSAVNMVNELNHKFFGDTPTLTTATDWQSTLETFRRL